MTSIRVDIDRLKRMEKALKESGWEQPVIGYDYVHADYRDTHVKAARERAEETLNRVDELIDVLGLRDEYPNGTYEMFRPWNGGYYEKVTTFGRGRFLQDIHAAHEASTGAEALKRIRSVLGKK